MESIIRSIFKKVKHPKCVLFALPFLALALIQCAKKAEIKKNNLAPVQPLQPKAASSSNEVFELTDDTFLNNKNYFDESITLDENSACNFWDSLPSTLPEHDEEISYFQLIDKLSYYQVPIYAPLSPTPYAYSRPFYPIQPLSYVYYPKAALQLQYLPELLYALSKESDDETIKKLHSPPNLITIHQTLEADKSFFTKNFTTDNFKLYIRNNKLASILQEKLPGVLNQEPGPLNSSKILEDLKLFTGISNFTLHQKNDFENLTKKVPLFISSSWNEREKELRRTLLILNRNDVDKLSVSEKICQFAIFHRFSAQLISLKGIQGAPKLTQDGNIDELPKKDNEGIKTKDIPGLFTQEHKGISAPIIISEDFMLRELSANNLKRSTLQLKNTSTLYEQIAAIRYLTTLTSFRTDRIWKFDNAQKCENDRPCLPAKLLKMVVGLHAILLNNFKKSWIDPLVDLKNVNQNTLRFPLTPEDPTNLALLIHTIFENLNSYQNMALPNLNPTQYALDIKVLNEQISRINDPQEGMIKQLKKVFLLLVTEALYRDSNGMSNEELDFALLRVLKNRSLRNQE
jgi:hypothetical protein